MKPGFPWIRVLLACLIALFLAITFTGCAQTVFYRDGHKVASFQADMTGVEYTMGADGSISWKAVSALPSIATKAQGDAATGKIGAIGTAATVAGVSALF